MPRPTNRLIVLHALCGESEAVSSKFVADKTGLPCREVARHLRVLKSMGLVRSHAGQKTQTNPMLWFIVFLPSVGGKPNGKN